MTTAQPTDWQTKPMPAQKITVELGRMFSAEEMATIRRGLVPQQMEDKWFIYWQDNRLFFHRSWTGFCIYSVHFAIKDGGAGQMVAAEVNRDPEQYRQTSAEEDARMISYLVDVLLLRRRAQFPHTDADSAASTLANWSIAGRAMLGEHPEDDEKPAE